MNSQERVDFARVAEAITYIRQDFKKQPGLEQIAEKVGLSPSHFQRLFTNWEDTIGGLPVRPLSLGGR